MKNNSYSLAASIQKPPQNKLKGVERNAHIYFMIKLTNYQESELRKFIEDTGNKYGVNAQPLQYSECLSGLRIGNTHDYIVSFDSSISEKYYDYVVSLDPLLSENYYMVFT